MNNEFIKLAIIGNTLSHSISPAIQKAALDSVNLNGSYEKFEVKTDNLKSQVEYFIKNNYSGFNVTIPYKVEIIKYLDEIDSLAEKIGAVNTVKINSTGKLKGYNTDIYGFTQAINSANISNAVVLGAGGAAMAVIFGLDNLGCKNISLYVRDLNKINESIATIKSKISANIQTMSLTELTNLSDTDILVNATPLGTKGANEDFMAINETVLETANKNLIVYDLVYNPQETKLIKSAKRFDLITINGLNMLINQGAKAFEIWTDFKPNTELMQKAALAELN